MILKKIYNELVLIRKELQTIRGSVEYNKNHSAHKRDESIAFGKYKSQSF